MGIKLEPSDQKANRLTTRQIPRPIKKCHHTNIFPIDSQHPPQRLGIRQEAVYVDDNDFHQLTCLRLTKPQGKTKVMHKFQSSMFLLFQSSFSTQLLLSKNMVINHLRKKKYDFQLPVSRENRIVLARTDTVKNLSFVTPTCFKGKYFQLLVKYFGFEFTVRAIVCLNVANFLTLAHSRLLLFLYFRLFKTVDGKIKLYWFDSSCSSMVWEAVTLPTVPQPSCKGHALVHRGNVVRVSVSSRFECCSFFCEKWTNEGTIETAICLPIKIIILNFADVNFNFIFQQFFTNNKTSLTIH